MLILGKVDFAFNPVSVSEIKLEKLRKNESL
jgi:hypothetical protein